MLVSRYQPFRPIEILSVTVNPGDDALASEYETTRDSWESTQNPLLVLAKDGAAEAQRWCGWRGQRTGRRGRRRAFRRIALGREERTQVWTTQTGARFP